MAKKQHITQTVKFTAMTVLFLVLILAVFTVRSQSPTTQSTSIASKPQVTRQPTPTRVPVFKKTDLTANYYYNLPYPTEISQLKAGQLTPTSCDQATIQEIYNSQQITDFQNQFPIIAKSMDLSMTNKPDLLTYQTCKSDNNTSYVLVSSNYHQKSVTTQEVSIWRSTNLQTNATKLVTMKPNQSTYFTCDQILAITKTGTYYVSCSIGDGGGHVQMIYRYDTTTQTTKNIFYCSLGKMGKSKPTCESL